MSRLPWIKGKLKFTPNIAYTSVANPSSTSDGTKIDPSIRFHETLSSKPRTLRKASDLTRWWIVKDVVLLGLPACFVALAIIAQRLDKKPISSYGDTVIRVSQFGPTIFPIFFAAIASNAVRNIARHKIERGERLGVLEQLMGSQSLAGTITRIFELRTFHSIGVAMLLVWGLSPLGGQSALRLISIEQAPIHSIEQVSYARQNGNDSWVSGSDAREAYPAISSLYTSSLFRAEQTQNDAADVWGHPKLPFLESLAEIEGDNEGWRTVANAPNVQYSSLIGVRLQGLPADANTTLSIENSYDKIQCSAAKHRLPVDNLVSFLGPLVGWDVRSKDAFTTMAPSLYANATTSSFLAGAQPNWFTGTTARKLVWVAKDNNCGGPSGQCASVYNCTIQTARVEAEVLCQFRDCAVTRMRPSLVDTTNPNVTSLQYGGPSEMFRIVRFFPFAAGYIDELQASPTDNFIVGDTPFNFTYFRDWPSVSDANVSTRLTMAFNSVRRATWGPWSTANANTFLPLRCFPTDEPISPLSNIFDNCENMSFTTAQLVRFINVYHTNRVWVSILLLCSLVLLGLGVLSITLQSIVNAPDVLGYVSTLTKDNPYVRVPTGASSFSGLHRSRKLRKLRVQLADVRPHEETGYIALKSLGRNEKGGRLDIDRLYT